VTDRHSGYIVTLDADIREDDAEAIVTALDTGTLPPATERVASNGLYYLNDGPTHPLGGPRCTSRHRGSGAQCWGHDQHELVGAEHVAHIPGSRDDIVVRWEAV
jgi:hypothetical protein